MLGINRKQFAAARYRCKFPLRLSVKALLTHSVAKLARLFAWPLWLLAIIAAPAAAQVRSTAQAALCESYRAEVDLLTRQLAQTPLWDDVTIARARSSLASLEASRRNIIRLTRRLNEAEESSANAEAFDRSGERNFWRQDARGIRAEIDNEKKKAKLLAAAAGVSCPGCTYSVLVGKVRAAIDTAVAARMAAFQANQQIISYKRTMAAGGC